MEDNRIRHRRNQNLGKEIEPYKKELESCKKTVKINPKNPQAWFNLGLTYFRIGDQILRITNYKKAIESFKKVVEIDSMNTKAWYKMGYLYSQIGNYKKAIESYKKVVEIVPNHSIVWERISYLYYKLGNHEKAEELSEKAEEIIKKAEELLKKTILMDRFRFLRDDVFLCPRVNPLTGEQNLVLQKINLDTNEIEFEDEIYCIHTVITDISPKEFENYQNDTNVQENINKKILEIRSSEDLVEINLAPKEKFKALKSWTAGITETGLNAFLIQDEIDRNLNLLYPISHFLMRFMVKVDRNFLPDFIMKIERECMFEGIRHESSFIANTIPILEMVWKNYSKNKKIESEDIEIVKMLASLDNSGKLFKSNTNFLKILRLCTVPRDYLRNFTVKMDKERQTQDGYDESKEIDKLISKINDIFYGDYSPEFYEANWNTDVKIHHAPISGFDYGIIKGICDLDISYKLFKDHPHELMLIARNEIDYFRNHLKKFEEECQTDGKLNESKFIDYLISIIDSFNSDYREVHGDLFDFEPVSNIDKTLIKIVCRLDTSFKILKDNPKYLWLFAQADPDYFDKCFKSNVKDIKIQNKEDELNKDDYFKLYCILGDIIDAIGTVIDSSCGIKGMKTITVKEATIEVTRNLMPTLDEIHRIDIKYGVFKDSPRYKSILQGYKDKSVNIY